MLLFYYCYICIIVLVILLCIMQKYSYFNFGKITKLKLFGFSFFVWLLLFLNMDKNTLLITNEHLTTIEKGCQKTRNGWIPLKAKFFEGEGSSPSQPDYMVHTLSPEKKEKKSREKKYSGHLCELSP